MIKIHVYNADSLVTELESAEDKEISIGRAQGASIVLDDPTISRLHAVIFPLNGGWVLQRKANFGAVLLNGTEVENAPLEGGEEVTIGPFSLRVEIEAPQPTSLTGSKNVTSSKAMVPREQTGALDVSGGDGRTKFVNSGVSALFRMEPGSGNVDEFLMEKDVALFGRGSNCDVVLTEKKASRKHFEVRRQGLSFFLKDLNSANGTVVNGSAVTEAELVAGDLIQVGESRIQFSIENKAFFAQQDQFLPVPAHLSQAAHVDMGGLAGIDGAASPADAAGPELGPDGSPLPPKPNSGTDFIGHAKYRWAKIPKAQRMRYLTILVVGCLVMAFLGEPNDPKPLPPKKNTGDGKSVRRFEDLTEKNKKYVKDNYKDLLEARERKDYSKMVDASSHILSLVDEYNDTKSYEAIAKRGLDQIEEERKRRENEEKQRKVKEEVAKLEEKGDVIFEKALKDPKARTDLDAVIQEIYAKDPNNHKAAEWKQKIKDSLEEEKRAAEVARQKEELRQKAEDEFARVDKIFKSEKYIDAIKEAEKLNDVGYAEKEFLERVEKLKTNIREKLHSVLDPLLTEARNQRQDGGDLVKARDKYNDVLRVDAMNEEARHGLNEIRAVLMLRAKRFYNEAILAESISDLAEAKEKYEKCLHTAPDDPNLSPNQDYRARCRRKLVRYDAFTPEPAGRN